MVLPSFPLPAEGVGGALAAAALGDYPQVLLPLTSGWCALFDAHCQPVASENQAITGDLQISGGGQLK